MGGGPGKTGGGKAQAGNPPLLQSGAQIAGGGFDDIQMAIPKLRQAKVKQNAVQCTVYMQLFSNRRQGGKGAVGDMKTGICF